MRKLIVKPRALSEQRQTLQYSRRKFGTRAARAYEALIRRAFQLLRADPARAGVRQLEELGSDFSLFHLRHARTHGAAPKHARHIIVFTYDDMTLTILRVLHDLMDIAERVGDDANEA